MFGEDLSVLDRLDVSAKSDEKSKTSKSSTSGEKNFLERFPHLNLKRFEKKTTLFLVLNDGQTTVCHLKRIEYCMPIFFSHCHLIFGDCEKKTGIQYLCGCQEKAPYSMHKMCY